jgi:hypothetical protein
LTTLDVSVDDSEEYEAQQEQDAKHDHRDDQCLAGFSLSFHFNWRKVHKKT